MPLLAIATMTVQTGTTSADPSCGKCGYCVRGLDSFTCPECGSDLREVGILTGTRRWRSRLVLGVIIWTFVLPAVALPVSWLLVHYCLPVVNEIQLQRVVFCMYPQLSTTITVRQEGSELVWNRSRFRTTVPTRMILQASGIKANPMSVDLTSGGYNYTDPNGTSVHVKQGFGREALLKWLASGGVNASDPLVVEGAADVLQCIDETPIAAGKFTPFSLRGTQDIIAHPSFIVFRSHTPPWCTLGLTGLWPLVWFGGLWKIFKRARKSHS